MTTRKLLALGSSAAALALLAAAPAADSAPQTPSGFTIVSSPTLPTSGQLQGVAAVSAANVWAVGTVGENALIEHYDGAAWSIVSAPRTGHGSSLDSVSAGAGAVWAVGSTLRDAGEVDVGLVERWTGSQWVRVRVPMKLSRNSAYQAVQVFSDTDVWIAGTVDAHHALLHYDGVKWRQVKDVDFIGSDDDYTASVAGADPAHVFAVGDEDSADGSQGMLEREVRPNHWTTVGSTASDFGFLDGVSASSAADVWAVGAQFNGTTQVDDPVAIHWDGTNATFVTVPGHTTSHTLASVAAISPADVWAVGERETAANASRTLIEHYTGGAAFADLGGPNLSGEDNSLASVAEVPGDPSDLWAVGSASGAAGGQPLILHHAP